MKKRLFLLFVFFILLAFFLHADETEVEKTLETAEDSAENTGEEQADMADENGKEADDKLVLTPEQIRQGLEIKTSTLPELALWCRTLGLSEGGTKDELSRRLREHFEIPEPNADAENIKVITIESAQTTEYFRIEVIDEDYARLSGEVRISLKDKDAVHKIKANDILLNRTRNILTARGGVEYIKEDGDSIETFRGENITVNIDDWSSIFLRGASEKKLENEASAYLFSGTVINSTNENVTILNKGKISNANNDEALWSLEASKIMLLPGSDFAIFNGVLKVGEIPVLYIPFFYYPMDEVIFHPVIGYRSREGAYVQTSTYILGRPKASASDTSSLSRLLGNSSDMEKERQGLFLKTTGKKIKDPDATSLKALIDYYTNLGLYMGIDLSTPKIGILNAGDFSLGIGLTRTIEQTSGGNYNPFAPNDYDGTFDDNYANLFGWTKAPRYRFKTESSINGRYGSLSWFFPFYSDPSVDKDFLDRSENMDWVNMAQQGAAIGDEPTMENILQSYQWQLNGNFRPFFPEIAPYVSNVSLNSFAMTMSFITIEDTNAHKDAPGRFFYAPDRATLFSVSASVSGTPLTLGKSNTGAEKQKQEIENLLKDIGVPRSPWPQEDNSAEKKTIDEKLVPPALNHRFDIPRLGNNIFSIDYQLSPTSSAELQFRSGYDNWKKNEDIDWNEIQSILGSIGGNSSVNFNINHSENFYSNTVNFSGSGTYRDYWTLNEEAEAYLKPDGTVDEDKIKEAKRQQYAQSFYSTNYAYTGTLRPLYRNPVFGQSNFQYSFRSLLVKSEFNNDGENPEWEPVWGEWDEVKPESHLFATNVSVNIMENIQNVSVSADLPPLDPLFSTNAVLRAWISETSASIRFRKPEEVNQVENDEWIIDPFYLNERLSFGKVGSFSFNMVMDPEQDNDITTITASLSLWNFKASFSALKMQKYEFVPDPSSVGGAWLPTDDEPALYPKDLTINYNRTFSELELIKNRIKFSLNIDTRLFFDLQRYTNSSFQFSMGFTLGINNFLDLSLSATSENAVIFRYFKDVPGMEDLTFMYPDGEQNNLFIDLFDSFDFADETKRRRSGFKMKSFNLAATHHLGDWNAILGVVMSSYLDYSQPLPKYDISADVSFLVQWVPISEIKTDMKYEKKIDKWTVK
ncbi:MAG: LPS-assembly protein LptD [Treponema sp.]|jgi:lipopolysaccharide assembly outer membrane protein LptD (OstA)|nr:LPS-assembly protein LptD [Treponema sp.]